MKSLLRIFRENFAINYVVGSTLLLLKKTVNKLIDYWPVSGKRTYVISGVPIKLYSNCDDGFVNRLFYNKGYDHRVLELYESLISSRRNIIYDIGANIGVFSLLAVATNPLNKIYSFEPNPINYNRLVENIKYNGFKNIRPYQIALGNDNRKIRLNKPVGNYISDVTSVFKSHTNRFTDFRHEAFIVEQVSLDDFHKKKNIEMPDIIKLDVELFEFEVLSGAKKLIQQKRPIVLIEIQNFDIVTGFTPNLKKEIQHQFTREIAAMLKEMNYHFYAIGEFGILHIEHLEDMVNVKNYLVLPSLLDERFHTFEQMKNIFTL